VYPHWLAVLTINNTRPRHWLNAAGSPVIVVALKS
jgi:hypothetical protein